MGGRRREGVQRKEEEEVSVSHVSVKLPLLSFLCKMNHVALNVCQNLALFRAFI